MNSRFRFSQPSAVGRRLAIAVGGLSLILFSFAGCGPSKEETKKQDEVGKQTNEEGMNRMLQDQAKKQNNTAAPVK